MAVTTDPGPRARVAVLLDPTDDATVTAGLLARHDPRAGCVVVHPTPGTHGPVTLAQNVLAALGRPIDAPRTDRIGGVRGAWLAATAWVISDRIEHLVVLRAHRLAGDGWAALVELAAASGATLLLVCHATTVPAHLRAWLPDTAVVLADLAAAVRGLETVRTRPAPPRPPRRQYADLPRRLPTGQVLYYRADVYRQQSPEVFARVDELYGRGLDAACQWLRHRPAPAPRQTTPADEQLQRFLTDLVHDSPTPQHTLALLRGVQAGFLLHGSWLAIPAPAQAGPRRSGGPGLTSTPVTFDIADRIRAGVANPVLAAGVALAMFTGLDLLSLRSLRLDALPPPGQVLLLPFRRADAPAAVRAKASLTVPSEATVVFGVPPPARPLLRAARSFLRGRSPDPRQRVFAGIVPMRERLTEAAARCELALPRRPAHLIQAWQLRVHWSGLDDPAHTNPPARTGAGRSCLTAQPAAADPAGAAPVHRNPDDDLGRRWSPINPPAFLPDLLRAYLDGTEPTLRGYCEYEAASPYAHTGTDARRRQGLIHQHLTVRVTPVATNSARRIIMHPDIAFALRLADRPAPPDT